MVGILFILAVDPGIIGLPANNVWCFRKISMKGLNCGSHGATYGHEYMY